MITSIEIDGFKSLRNFKMEFRKGLNVLAGPNGSGKTNILQAIEFLHYLTKGSVKNAVEFCMESFGDIFHRGGPGVIKFRVSGYDNYSDMQIDGDQIVHVPPTEYYMEFEVVSQNITYVARWLSYTLGGGDMMGLVDRNEEYESLNFIPGELGSTMYLSKSLTDAFEASFFDLSPYILRSVAGKSKKYLMAKNGIGFANALDYSIEGHPQWTVKKELLLDYFKLLPIGIDDYKSIKRPSSNELDIDVVLFNDGKGEDYSIRSLSDGVLCWMAISVALTQHKQGWCFDEPDRHLHPDMIQKMMSLFREHAEQGPGWLLMTTHNVSAIDLCDIEELQIVELNEEGHTRVRPVHNPENLDQVMRKYGRSLGSFYVSGSL